MRRFHLERLEDATGVSGTGRIAEGVRFSTGECVLNWLTAHRSQAFYQDVATLVKIHGHGGKTRLVWDDVDVIVGHPCGPHVDEAGAHWGQSKCQKCDAVFVEPDGVWYLVSDPSGASCPTPACR